MNCAKVQKVVLSTSLQPHFSPQITLPATSLTRALEINDITVGRDGDDHGIKLNEFIT